MSALNKQQILDLSWLEIANHPEIIHLTDGLLYLLVKESNVYFIILWFPKRDQSLDILKTVMSKRHQADVTHIATDVREYIKDTRYLLLNAPPMSEATESLAQVGVVLELTLYEHHDLEFKIIRTGSEYEAPGGQKLNIFYRR
ncbi:hypothetical protein SAMN05421823_102559 [Catalinimonas alkaloidigena]|uniref:Uncharacterized protein n=1 Tax=Catalinimonas alkaloidigena TaxID=1075417 RepID=A0A1G9B9T8_9BACT|nr:hypothetical protein [Catalinimonas alkaloidigena]SDK36281.1 hypothetical protein SAMN05421823_102559 [Catalinimonas alkaloidigena]